MRSRTLTVRQLDADRKPLGEPVVITVDPDTVTFDWTLDDAVDSVTVADPFLDHRVASVLSQPPG